MENQNIAINSIEDLINHINKSNITSDSGKIDLAIELIEQNPDIIKSSTELSAFIKDLGITSEYYKQNLAVAIIEQKPDIIKSSKELSDFIKDLGIEHDVYKRYLEIAIIEKNPEVIKDLTSSTELLAFIKDLGVTSEHSKIYLAIAIIKQKPEIINKITSSTELSAFIKDLGIEHDGYKRYLEIAIIEKNPEIIKDLTSSQELSAFIKDLGITSEYHKQNLAIAIIKEKPEIINKITSSQKLLSFIKDLGFTNDDYRINLTKKIINRNPKIIKDLTDLRKLSAFIKDLGFEHDNYKRGLATEIIKQKPEILGDNKEKGLSELIKAFGNDFYYRVDLICTLLKELPQTIDIDFKTLNNNLYQNDYLKEELILEAIASDVLHKDNFLKCGFDEIKTDDIYLYILEKAKAKNIITDLDLLNHNKGRLSSKFTSINKLFDINLEENKLNDIFANEGNSLNTIASWFASSNNQFNIKQYKLSDIIEYCRSSGKLTELNSLFTAPFKEKIKKLYIPSSQKVITDVDIKQIAELTGFSIEEVAKKHISIGEMASRLQHLFAGIKEATLDDIKEIKNDKIKEILTKTLNNGSVDDQDAKSFYKEITGLDIKNEDISKLKAFISGNKDILTYIFKKEDGLARLAGVMHSIGDGCGANIANNLNNMAISFLLDDNEMGEKNKNIALKLLYESLIAGGILQQALGYRDDLGSDSNSSVIRNCQKGDPENILNKRFITCDYLIEAIAKISNSDKHSDIVPKKIKDLILANDYLLENFSKIIATNVIKFLIKDDKNQDKITNNNSVIYRAIYEAISIEEEKAKQAAGDSVEKKNEPPNNTINRPTILQQLCSCFSCYKK